jgi:hypothetical protein
LVIDGIVVDELGNINCRLVIVGIVFIVDEVDDDVDDDIEGIIGNRVGILTVGMLV